MTECLLSPHQDPDKTLYTAIGHIENVLESSFIDTTYSGSTLICTLLLHKNLICANTGDSRAILARKSSQTSNQWSFLPLSTDHKPDVPEEKARILKSGGIIQEMRDCEGRAIGPLRVWPCKEANMGLAMSRSIGDKSVKPFGVTWEPGFSCNFKKKNKVFLEIKKIAIEEGDRFMVLGSDGVWEVISSQEVCF